MRLAMCMLSGEVLKMASEEMLSVGIDIGTSTTQVIFSKLTMENTASYFSVPRVSIVDKELVYQSRIYRTPLRDRIFLDGEGIGEIVAKEFDSAGVSPSDTRTGAVIITGESARKENASIVLEQLSGFAGEFVVSTAGPDLEAIVAGKGSGAQQYAKVNGCYTANLDIGGGTSNIVLFAPDGRTVAKGCLDIGGRQICLSSEWTVTYCSPSARCIAESLGLQLSEGLPASPADVRQVCQRMAQLLEQMLLGEESPLLHKIQTAGSSQFVPPYPVQAVCFSGGVADCIRHSGQDALQYGDIGVLLGQAIRESGLFQRFRMVDAQETIRATVVGAGSYTTSVSGSTITYDPGLLPQKNLPVLKLTDREQTRCIQGDWMILHERIAWFMKQTDSRRFLLALPGKADPSYEEIRQLADALSRACEQALYPEEALFLAVERDMAKALGQQIRLRSPKRGLVVIDSVQLEQNDYLDMGRPVVDGLAIPVVVKTLIFG